MKSDQEFKDLLKEARAKTGLSQQALAALLEIPTRTYESWEMGERTPQKLLQTLLLEKLQLLQTSNTTGTCPLCGRRIKSSAKKKAGN